MSSTIAPSPSSTIPPDKPIKKIGPIDLPAFVALCIFVPFALTFIAFIFWYYTVRRYKNKKQLKEQEKKAAAGEGAERDVEMQLRGFTRLRIEAKPLPQEVSRPK